MKQIQRAMKERADEKIKVDKQDMKARDEYWKQIEAEIQVNKIAEKQL